MGSISNGLYPGLKIGLGIQLVVHVDYISVVVVRISVVLVKCIYLVNCNHSGETEREWLVYFSYILVDSLMRLL
jgi:hypothetical protein